MRSEILKWLGVSALAVIMALVWMLKIRTETARHAVAESKAIATQRDELIDRLAALQAVSKIRAEAQAELAQERAEAQEGMHNALQDNAGWADEPVPDGVWLQLSGSKSK